MIHEINILVHVTAGTIALIIGVIVLFYYRQTTKHKRFGRYFLYLLALVVVTGFSGWLFFRSNSFLLMLTLLAGYVGYAGFRTIRLRERKGNKWDALIAIMTLTTGILYLLWLRGGDGNWSPSVIYSTLLALALVTVYDLLKYFWLHPAIKGWWLYEHIYKMLSAFSALLSAFVGTVLPDYHPYSQVGPSAVCVWLIVFFIWQQARLRAKPGKMMKKEQGSPAQSV